MNGQNPESSSTSGSTILEREVQVYLSQNLHLLGVPDLQLVSVEYAVDVGRIDILARGKYGEFLVIETKRGTGTREDVGQVLSYLGAVQQQNPGARVMGLLVAASIDAGAEAAIRASPNVRYCKYTTHFAFELHQRREEPTSDPVIGSEPGYCATCNESRIIATRASGLRTCTRCGEVADRVVRRN
ncbi:MAG: endonuclease NucS domain-containing protein [Burkholderiales bacterium]